MYRRHFGRDQSTNPIIRIGQSGDVTKSEISFNIDPKQNIENRRLIRRYIFSIKTDPQIRVFWEKMLIFAANCSNTRIYYQASSN